MVDFGSLAGAVVDLIRVDLLWAEHAARWNVNIFLYMLLLVRNGAIGRLINLIQIPSALGIFGFG